MFYAELIDCLRADAATAATVATFTDTVGAYPAVFANEAPEGATKPYIVVNIDGRKLPDSVIMTADVKIDYYDYNASRAQADAAQIAVEDLLDTMLLTSENFTYIRFSLESEGYINMRGEDPRDIHHNSTFSTRAARSGWMRRTL